MNLSKKEQAVYDNKISKIMGEWKDGTLKSNGKVVKTQKQALAIAISSALAELEDYRKNKTK